MDRISRPSQPPSLRQTTFNDYEQVAALELRHGLTVKNRDEWVRLWTANPVFQLNPNWPIGWVLENDHGEIVGSLENIPLHYELQGDTLLTAAGRAWATDSDYRSYAPLLMDEYFNQKNVALFLNTTVNSQAAKAFGLFGSLPVPAGHWDSAAYWITRRRAFTKKVLQARRIPFAGFCSYPAAAGLAMRELLLRKGLSPGSRITIEHAASFDHRFDAFWRKLRDSRPGILLGNRSRETLNWHFHQPLILTCSESSGLIAYAVFQRKDYPQLGITRVRLIDFQTLGQPGLFAALLHEALSECARREIDVLENIGSGVPSRQIIDSCAPYRRKLGAWSSFYKARNTPVQRALENPRAWDPSSFDGDASL